MIAVDYLALIRDCRHEDGKKDLMLNVLTLFLSIYYFTLDFDIVGVL